MRLKIKRLICILAAVSATSMALPANAVSPVLLASEKQETMFYDGTDKGFILKDKEAVTGGDMVYESSEKAVSKADIAKAIEWKPIAEFI